MTTFPPTKLRDDIDPAPRILRLIAQALTHSRGGKRAKGSDPDVVALRLVADCLEGKGMTYEQANSYLGRMIAKERRVGSVYQTSVTSWTAKRRKKADPPLSPEDQRFFEQAVESGKFEEIEGTE